MCKDDTKTLKREHPITTLLNEKEFNAITKFCKKYKYKNRSHLIRQMVFTSIIQQYEKDYPTLFDKQVMADLVIEPR
jgi:metal-responsive CopG/Arc/MetJ family transcriptional regulator